MTPTFPANPTPSSSSNFQLIFCSALKAYEKQTKKDLLAHPLASQLQKCDSPASILTIIQSQVNEHDQARNSDERLTRWLGPTINVLLAFSGTIGEGVSLVCLEVISFLDYGLTTMTQVFSPAKVIFAGAGVLLQVCLYRRLSATELDTEVCQAIKDVSAAQEALIDIFERIENFFKRLETYTEVRPSAGMTDIIVKIMVEVLNILGIATKEIEQGRTSERSTCLDSYTVR